MGTRMGAIQRGATNVWGSVAPNCPLWFRHQLKGLLNGVVKLALAGEGGVETARQFSPQQIANIFKKLISRQTRGYFSTNNFVDMQLLARKIIL